MTMRNKDVLSSSLLILALSSLSAFTPLRVCGQQVTAPPPHTYLGLGLGQDFGGIGFRVDVLPEDHISLFAGLGYAFAGFGYNVGAHARLLPGHKVCPYVTAMYGYTAVITVKNASQYDKIYYGPTFGAGLEVKNSLTHNFWKFGILIPIRPQAYQYDLDALKKNPSIKFSAVPIAITISVGYHFGL